MVSSHRVEMGDNAPPPPIGENPQTHTLFPPQNATPITLLQNLNQTRPTGPTPPPVTFSWDQLQRLILECQTQAIAGFQAQGTQPTHAMLQETRPLLHTPALAKQPHRRREGPTDSTAHSPHGSQGRQVEKDFGNTERNHTALPGVPRRSLRFHHEEEVAESLVNEEPPRPRQFPELWRDVERPPHHESLHPRPELEGMSQQIQHLSKQVEILARREFDRPTGGEQARPMRNIMRAERDANFGVRARRERESPFCENIAMERINGEGALPTGLPRYNGSTDPMQHLLKFEHLMELHGHNSNIYAKVLVTTFQDLALEWFTRLEPRSIASYDQLTEKFLHQFASKRKSRMPHTNLYSVKQGDNESTRSFMERFNNEVLKVETPTVNFLVDVLYFGLKNKALAGALAREKPRTMEKLLSITDSYVEEEEMSRIKYGGRESKGKQKEKEHRPRREGGDRSPIKRYADYTPLNTDRKQIFLAIQHEDLLKTPRKIHDARINRTSDKFCLFHKQKGHNTEDCHQLMNEVERLIKSGFLKKFVANRKEKGEQAPILDTNPRRSRSRSPRQDRENPPVRGVIDTIAGGPVGGDSKSSRKKSERKFQEECSRQRTSRIYHLETPKEVLSFDASDCSHLPTSMATERLDCPMVITADVSNFSVRKVLIDSGSSANIIFSSTLRKMGFDNLKMEQIRTPLIGFGGGETIPLGQISLPTSLGSEPKRKTLMISYLVVDSPFAYNIILGRPALNDFQAVVSTFHLKMKFPTSNGVGEMICDPKEAWRCYSISLEVEKSEHIKESKSHEKHLLLDELHAEGSNKKKRLEDSRIEPFEEYKLVELEQGNAEKYTKIGSNLEPQMETLLISFLQRNKDIFAWKAVDLQGIDPHVIVHRLNVDPIMKPVRQKERRFSEEKNKIISDEVDKLLEADYIQPIQFTDWVCNVVLVPKSGGKWRMCNDFTDLNKACPKDPYPLPKIDQLVDSTAGCELLSMMDAFQGYYQIPMAEEDRPKTSFVVKRGVFCFSVMPFGLKNAGATYQRLVNTMFRKQIGKSVEVYIDDMIVKSVEAKDHLSDLSGVFDTLRKYRLKLNPAKCTFGVRGGKFLGFMVSQRGIEANPEKIEAIQAIRPPRSVKEVQKLVGRIIALSRFISRLADKSLPFFKALRTAKKFEWTDECSHALEELKKYLSSPPLLIKPMHHEKLGLYLAVSSSSLSSVLVSLTQEHRPVYYLSRVLQGAEKNYKEIELFALALVHSARKLRPYFQSHPIVVLTNQQLRQVLAKPDLSGRLAKWSVELSEFDISFQPRTAIKAQSLADFLVEDESKQRSNPSSSHWIAHVDGSSVGNKGGAGVFFRSAEGLELDFAIKLDYGVTNNEAEYEAVIAALLLSKENDIKELTILTDSQLVVSHFEGSFEAREESMIKYLCKVKSMVKDLESFTLQQIPREENARADALSKFAYALEGAEQRKVTMLLSPHSAISGDEVSCVVDTPLIDWRTQLLDYLKNGILPDDRSEARRLRVRAARYIERNGILLKRSIDGPWLKCLGIEQAKTVMQEIHEGVCGNHVSGRILALKIRRAGYFWPTLLKDSISYAGKCSSCQINANVSRQPASELKPIESAWPFDQWGIDLVGPFPPASGQRKFLIVAVEYFTKWVEAEAIAKITDANIWNFIWKNIICRFGVPKILISDNGTQFQSKKMQEWCEEVGIQQRFVSVGHPQANGQTEVTNRTIVSHLKTRLNRRKGNWADDLPAVLWAYRSTPRTTTNETPFALVYGSEAVIPIELLEESPRVQNYDPAENEEQRALDIDLVEERRLKALTRAQSYQSQMARAYNKHVKARTFQVGDWVLKNVEVSKHIGKLDPKWDGPYKVIEHCGNNAYKLADENDRQLPRSWNARNLKKFYV